MINFDTLQQTNSKTQSFNYHDLDIQQRKIIALVVEGVPVKKAIKMSEPKKRDLDYDKEMVNEAMKENRKDIKAYNRWMEEERRQQKVIDRFINSDSYSVSGYN